MVELLARVAFYALTSAGIAAALVAIAVLLVASVRRRDADLFGRSVPWTLVGAGLLAALLAFWTVRMVSAGRWPVVDDLAGLVVVLGVASAGFATVCRWAAQRSPGRRGGLVRWTAPVALSLLLGLTGGLSTVPV